MTRRVLLIGGTGVFGRRLARHLSPLPGIDLFVTSRSESRARAFAEALTRDAPGASVTGVGLDHDHELAERLRGINPFVAVDCSGPFQNADYAVARAVIAAGSHMIDLADARDYLRGYIDAIDGLARKHGVTALAGASSTPALSTVVVDALTINWRRIDAIDTCITPAGQSDVGRSVSAAIMSYAGEDIPVWREGRQARTPGWMAPRHVTMPGLGRRRVAAVETFDAEFLGNRRNVTSRITFSAGLESRIEQWGLEAIGRLRKARLIPDPGVFIPVLLAARKITRLISSDRGGMVVKITGLNENRVLTKARWWLLAEQDDGPFVPVFPASAAVRALLAGNLEPAARLARDSLSLADIEAEMRPYSITTRTDETLLEYSAFSCGLGPKKFNALPAAVKAFHSQDGEPVWSGVADVETAKFPVTALISRIFGFPVAGSGVPICVTVDRDCRAGGPGWPREIWIRNFAGRRMSSTLECRPDGTFTETFGPLRFEIGLEANDAGLSTPLTGWRLGVVPLPRFLAPRSEAREYQDHLGRFRFDVKLTLPLLGLFAHYKGWLLPRERRDRA